MPIYLSATSIADFVKCPQKVLYRLKKTVPEVLSKEMIMGRIVHTALERGWNNRERAYSIVNSEIKSTSLKKQDQTKMEFMLDLFFLNFRHLIKDNDLIEFKFKLPLYDDVFIVGKMDRISNGNLYDWKTGITANKLGNDVQCIVYDWAYNKHFGHSPSSICIASLTNGQLIPYTRDSLANEELFDNIIPRMIRTIKHDLYERTGIFNHSCFRCVYKAGCLGTGESEYVLDSPDFVE